LTKTFRQLARDDRAGLLGISEQLQQKEFKLASRLGVYAASQR
jgi:hypothetical protein